MGTTVHDVARYILDKRGAMSAYKLQKLCYYTQAWHLAFFDRPLYPEVTQAWANGPVSPDLYAQHRGRYRVAAGDLPRADPGRMTSDEKAHVDLVLKAYGDWEPHALVELTHREDPWRDARHGLPPLAYSDAEITHEAMATFYRALSEDQDAELLVAE